MKLTFKVTESYAGKTAYTVLRREFGCSASLVRRLKHSDGIAVNGISVFSNHVLALGDIVSADVTAAEPPCDIVPEHKKIDILYESEGLIAVNKPCGILVHPSRSKYTGTLANFVAGYLLDAEGSGACHAVNRLDRDTSGVVLFARNSYMKDISARALSESSVKRYIAIVHGVFDELSGVISLPIKRFEEGNMLRVVSSDGKPAVTRYETIMTGAIHGEAVSMLRLTLETGRTHQIRVHCLACGHPLLGDTLYYNDRSAELSERLGIHAQALHALTLSFTDPLTRRFETINAPLVREDMKNIAAAL